MRDQRLVLVTLLWGLAVATGFFVLVAGCTPTGNSSKPANLPLVKPPVKAATPAGLLTDAMSASALTVAQGASALSSMGLQYRFFSPGPTDIFGILDAIDGRIQEINRRSEEAARDCLDQAPVPYDLVVFGQTLTFYAQCFDVVTTPPGTDSGLTFFQFGKKDGSVYLYSAIGPRTAAIVTPVPDAPGEYTVRAWMSVGPEYDGTGSDFDAHSYGVMELEANSSTRTFEFAASGINVGYCGAQLRSDRTSVYAIGSEDGWGGCGPATSLCVAASDVTTPATCDASLTTFDLPALGRVATTGPTGVLYAPSDYPGGSSNIVVLDGTASDSVHFGPSEPTPGVGRF